MQFKNKKFTKILLATVLSASMLLSGCDKNVVEENSSGAEKSVVAKTSAESAPTSISAARNTPVVQVAKNVGPAVVGITNKAVVNESYFDFFRGSNVEIPRETEGVGSGVVFRKDGYIVTNNHVVAGAKELIVSLSDGNTLTGELVGADELTDIAVVKVQADNLPFAKFGNSDEIMVGEPAIAIGNPLGLEFQGSVTVGVVSALNRTLEIADKTVKLIQTDAAINPGNSGGALLNYDGEVIGINSAKLATTGVEGMGFAIPINTVQTIIDELIEKGYVARPYLGVTIFDKQTAARYGYQLTIDKGVYVFQIYIGCPADRAGLQRGDVILSVEGKEVNSVAEVRAEIMAKKIGDTIKVTYDRDGKENTAEVTLQEMPQEKQ